MCLKTRNDLSLNERCSCKIFQIRIGDMKGICCCLDDVVGWKNFGGSTDLNRRDSLDDSQIFAVPSFVNLGMNFALILC